MSGKFVTHLFLDPTRRSAPREEEEEVAGGDASPSQNIRI